MIHPQYQGQESIAITTFKGDYTWKLSINPEELEKSLRRDAEVLGKKYRVLAVYHGVGPACQQKIITATDRLRTGQKIDLSTLLDNI